MRERIVLLGGRLKLDSAPGAGTRVSLAVPLNGSRAPADTRVRVVLIEDHTAVREAIAAMFAREPDFRVVGQAATMAEAGAMLHADVDVAVIDLGLPDGFGGDLIRDLHRNNPRAHALVLTASLDRTDMARAVERGAAGMLDKAARLDEVVDAVRRLRAGENLMPVDEMARLLAFARRRRTEEFDDRRAIDTLTARELEVLQALADGLDNQAVADRLRITIRTERNHVANILAKLGVHSRLQALVFALRYDLVRIQYPREATTIGSGARGRGNASSIARRSSGARRTPSASAFSRTSAGVRIIGSTASRSCRRIHASTTCAGVAPWRRAIVPSTGWSSSGPPSKGA